MQSKNHSIIASSEHAEPKTFFEKSSPIETLPTEDILANATGPVAIPMTNDYLFRALLQRNNKVLKGLISSLLHLPISQITSVEITNPILLGKAIDEKNFILDIVVLLNNYTTINLEMQVIHHHNWSDRSLSYLCRTFDQLNTGDTYSKVKPVIQIGFLDFTLFPSIPEFYATYKLLNQKTHALYSDKFTLSVIDLTCIHLATEEDKKYQVDYWASLFKAKTWEEIKMLAAQNEYIKEASDTIYMLSHEEDVREQCRAREDYYRLQRTTQYYLEKAETERDEALEYIRKSDLKMVELENANTKLENSNAKLVTENAELATENAELATENTKLESEISKLKAQIADLAAALAGKTTS